jgi:hypothetical protein
MPDYIGMLLVVTGYQSINMEDTMSLSFLKLIPSKWPQMGGKLLLISVLLTAILIPATPAVTAATGVPTFTITDVVPDTSATIQTSNFPANETFNVMMGKFGTLGIGGTVVGTMETGEGGTIEATYSIPDDLKGSKLIAIRLESESEYYSYNWFTNSVEEETVSEETPVSEEETPAEQPAAISGIPSFAIQEVVADISVTIRTSNFPAETEFIVLMGPYGTKATGGIEVGTTNSGAGGEFEETYTIPESLAGSGIIAIRLESADGLYFSYNWFFNSLEAQPAQPVPVSEVSGTPGFSIVSTETDGTVTIKTSNFPVDESFTVRMGAFGKKAVGGVVVGTTESGKGGEIEVTYTIPDELKGTNPIAIRMDSDNGFFAYNWFFNTTSAPAAPDTTETPDPDTADTPPQSAAPSFTIVSVVKNTSVTIKTSDLPAGQIFTARMGAFGTKAIDGFDVGTAESGEGGETELTFEIPAELADSRMIAIRLDSADGTYFSYNWFFNN